MLDRAALEVLFRAQYDRDMHAHVDDHADLYPYFAHGVTGLREMAQRGESKTDSFRAWQRQIAAGTRSRLRRLQSILVRRASEGPPAGPRRSIRWSSWRAYGRISPTRGR